MNESRCGCALPGITDETLHLAAEAVVIGAGDLLGILSVKMKRVGAGTHHLRVSIQPIYTENAGFLLPRSPAGTGGGRGNSVFRLQQKSRKIIHAGRCTMAGCGEQTANCVPVCTAPPEWHTRPHPIAHRPL